MNLPAAHNPGSGDRLAEYHALRETAGILDLSDRSRLCLIGNDRARFLHGQVTNDVKKLRPGEGCYAAIVTAKGKMESDAAIYALPEELLLDFEPGLTAKISQRLEKYIVADDVQLVDAAPHYGLLSVQGPKAEDVVRRLGIFPQVPEKPFGSVTISDAAFGEIYLANRARLGSCGYDLFVPINSADTIKAKLIDAAGSIGGRLCSQEAFEVVRIENGVPRFGVDMDETNIPIECGIEEQAISYRKGCYIGQEVINRIHSIGHVNKQLRTLRLAAATGSHPLPKKGDKLFCDGKEVGYITSAVQSPGLKAVIALGYIRREVDEPGKELMLRTAAGDRPVKIDETPFPAAGLHPRL